MQKVYYNHNQDFSEIAITNNNVLEHYYKLKDGFLTGSIFVGKVKFVKKHVGIFVDIGHEKDGLLTYREGLKAGDCVVVQVSKEPTLEKGCALTEKITIPGRFVILNDLGEYKFSHKLSEDKKIELFSVPQIKNVGFIFRSACQNADKMEISKEMNALNDVYNDILSRSTNVTSIKRVFSDNALSIAKRFASSDEYFIDNFDEILGQIKSLGERKVYVQGVELVFDKTEAMMVVDVNIHKFDISSKDVESANFSANTIAFKEIARQLRLRNVGGIIMVDFISQKQRDNVKKLIDILMKELDKDNVKVKVELVESIGCIAIVRERRYSAL